MSRVLDIDGQKWSVQAVGVAAEHRGDDRWHLHKVRFDPIGGPETSARETWLRHEVDVPADSVLDQYGDEALEEAFLIAEEVR